MGIASTANSFAFHKNAAIASGTQNIRNNIFVNARSNAAAGTGKHYAVYMLTSGANAALSNNVYFAPGTNGFMGFDGATDVAAYAAGWVSGDINSFLADPALLNPTGTAATLNLHVDPATPSAAESGAIPVASVTTDFDNDPRNATMPDIGADEFSGSTPAPVVTLAALPATAQCIATARTITATVTSLGGPVTSVTLNYNNGSAGSVPMTLSTGSATNGTWTGTIPAASPANTTVTWSVSANNGTFTTTDNGASYQDVYLTGVTTTAGNSSSWRARLCRCGISRYVNYRWKYR